MRRSLLKCVKCRVSLVLCGVVKSVFIPQRQESKHETDLKMKLCLFNTFTGLRLKS